MIVVLTGPESCGKTTLAKQLARHYGVPWIAEQARAWLEARGGDYAYADLRRIADLQWRAERELSPSANLVILDTDLLTIRIWSEVRFGRCDPWIVKRCKSEPAKRYLLAMPDLPWIPDPLRENPYDRDRLLLHQRRLLNDLGAIHAPIWGTGIERFARSRAVIDHWRATERLSIAAKRG